MDPRWPPVISPPARPFPNHRSVRSCRRGTRGHIDYAIRLVSFWQRKSVATHPSFAHCLWLYGLCEEALPCFRCLPQEKLRVNNRRRAPAITCKCATLSNITEPWDPSLFQPKSHPLLGEEEIEFDAEEIEEMRKDDICQCTRDLLLMERAFDLARNSR